MLSRLLVVSRLSISLCARSIMPKRKNNALPLTLSKHVRSEIKSEDVKEEVETKAISPGCVPPISEQNTHTANQSTAAIQPSAIARHQSDQGPKSNQTDDPSAQSQSDFDRKIGSTNDVALKVMNSARSSAKWMGAHVSSSGTIDLAISRAAAIGCRSISFFINSPRQWKQRVITDQSYQKFKDACELYGYTANHIVPHASYLMNLGSPDDQSLAKSRDLLLSETEHCERLGLRLLNIHPGSSLGKMSAKECCKRVAESINWVHAKTQTVIIVVETMAGQGNTVGGTFEQLQWIIDGVQDKQRVGVCLDTCHVFVAGYDIRSQTAYSKTMQHLDDCGLLPYLRAVHVNDSLSDYNSKLDRHADVGEGKIGLKGLGHLMNDPRFDRIPLVLETLEDKKAYELQMRQLYATETTDKTQLG